MARSGRGNRPGREPKTSKHVGPRTEDKEKPPVKQSKARAKPGQGMVRLVTDDRIDAVPTPMSQLTKVIARARCSTCIENGDNTRWSASGGNQEMALDGLRIDHRATPGHAFDLYGPVEYEERRLPAGYTRLQQ